MARHYFGTVRAYGRVAGERPGLLVGPAGTGKTAIAEALAHHIVSGAVPQPLIGVRFVSLQPTRWRGSARRCCSVPTSAW